MTSHPWDLSDRLIAALADCPSVCEHLHLPVQSGDDAVLRRMGRQYTIEHYLERLDRIREAVPGITISTDVIVGFCGETEAQFEATLRLLEHGPLRPGLRGRLPRATRHAGHAARRRRPARREAAPARTSCSALQEAIGLERNRAWLGRTWRSWSTRSSRRATHDHDDDAAETEVDGTAASRDAFARLPEGLVHLVGRSRENKLVHVAGSPACWATRSAVAIDHAGPYALRGRLA